jgi:lysophospholipase L1-like esterase
MSRNAGWHPIVIGRAASSSSKAISAIGDSITAGVGDTLQANGMGWFQRAIKKFSANPGSINFGVAASFTDAGSTDSRILNLITKYTPDGVSVFYGTNDLLFPASGVTASTVKAKIDNRVALIKAAGITKVSVSKLIACTTSTNNFADEAGQTATNAQWILGGPVQQLNALIDAAGYDLLVNNTTIIGVDPSKWKALNTDEGLHPNALGHDNKATSNATAMEAFFNAA